MADVARGSEYTGRRFEQPHFGVEAGHLLGRQVQVVDPELTGLAQDVVVDIGDVAHTAVSCPRSCSRRCNMSKIQVDGGVAEVGRVVGRDAARVHRHQGAGLEGHHLPPGGVVEPHAPQIPTMRSVECALWRMFKVIQTAVKASMAAAWLRLPALSGRRPRINSTSASVTTVASGWSEHTSTSASNPDSRFSISPAGRWWKAAATNESGSAA